MDYRYTGQPLEPSLNLYLMGARWYDPALARWLSPDVIVPGAASGSGGGLSTLGYDSDVRLGPLTVGFHEPQFLAELAAENRDIAERGFWFQRSAREQRDSDYPWGPLNPQALNRYAYCLSNPLRYVDPTGHDELLWEFQLTAETLAQFITLFGPFVADMGLFSVLFAALGTLAALGTPFGPFLVIPVADCAFEAYQGIYIQNYLQQLIDRSPTGSVTIRVYQSDLYGGTGFLIVGAGESTGIWITGLAALVFYDIFMNNAYGYDVHWQYQASWPGWFMWQYDMVMSLP